MDNQNEERPKPDTSRQAEIAFRLYDKDKDGYIWFDSRGDDVINSSGYKYNLTMTFLR